MLRWRGTTKEETVWEEKEKEKKIEKNGRPTEFFSLLCFVFFINKKGKHQKWCLNTEGENVGGPAVSFDGRTCLNVCSTHARWSVLWPLTCPPRSLCSGRSQNILECFIASLYSISWQNISHLIFPTRVKQPVGSPNSSCENVALFLSLSFSLSIYLTLSHSLLLSFSLL